MIEENNEKLNVTTSASDGDSIDLTQLVWSEVVAEERVKMKESVEVKILPLS